MCGMNDLHAHILWGMDDGAADSQETLDMLKAAASQGVRKLAATVHACPGVRHFDPEAYAARLSQAQALCVEHGLDISLLPGAEIAATFQTASALRNRSVPTLGNSDYALIELWHGIDWQKVYAVTNSVLQAGCIPILSHVERYSCFVWEPRRSLRFRRETGALLQMNASTLLRPQGVMCRRFVKRMLTEGGIDMVASDAHNMRHRPPNLGEARKILRRTVGREYAARLTCFEVSDP